MTYNDYKKLFQRDENGCFVNLIIPASNCEEELNLIGKLPKDFSTDEVVRMKKYSEDMFDLIDEETID